jgi:hypothetical protein
VSNSTWERWGPASGIAFVVLFVASVFVGLNFPDPDDSAAKFVKFYNDGGDRAQLIIGSYLMVLSGVFFFWFLASLRSRLLAAEGVPGRLTSIVFGSGLVFTALVMTAGAIFMTVAADITFGENKFVTVEGARLLPVLGYPILLIAGMFAAIAMIDATSVLIMRTGALPRWIGWFGFVTAVLLLFAVYFIPLLFLMFWVLAVSVAMLRLEPAAVPD